MSSQPIYQDVIAPNTHLRHRKPIIERLQKKLDGKLIVYTASPFHPLAQIMIQDVPTFEDMLRSTKGQEKGFLMLNSLGGNANAAEKLLKMCRQRFSNEFNVIVPDYAKSAATMLALGADKILMGYLAELGPVDPQITTGTHAIPARSFIDGLEIIRQNVRVKGDPVELYFPMLNQISPQVLAICNSAIDGSRDFVRNWLQQYMLKHDPKQAGLVAKWLPEGKEYKSHGKVIDYTEAHDILKLNVERIDPKSDLWNDIWELYCRSIAYLNANQGQGAAKLFESESVSLVLNLKPVVQRPQQRVQPQTPKIRKIPFQRPTPKPQQPTKKSPQTQPPKTKRS